MSPLQYLLFCSIALVQVGAPGPSTVFVINNAVTLGWVRAMLVLTGDLLAIAVLAILSLMGMDAVLMANPHLFMTLKIAGAGYLIWIGLDQWRRKAVNAVPLSEKQTSQGNDSMSFLWLKSFLVSISNPKAILFFSSLLPQFIDPSQTGTMQMLTLVSLFVLIKLLVLGSYAAIARRASSFMQSETNARWGKRMTGTILIIFGSLIAASAFS